MQAMTEQASAMDLPLEHFARKFAVTRLRCNMQGWWFHPLLGFSSMK
jgi:coproporphyrinogen III oxidase-like Fe-S oxidoreductase